MNSNLPSKKSVDELLQALETEDVVETIKEDIYEDDVLRFIAFYNIEPGTERVSLKVVHKLYKIFSENPLSPVTFYSRLEEHFDLDEAWIYTNRSSMDLSNALYKAIRRTKIKKKTVKSYKKHLESFFDAYQLKPGNFYVESFVIYYLYDEWLFNTKKRLVFKEIEMADVCKLYFTRKRLTESKMSWFGIDKQQAILSDDKLQQIRKWRQTYNDRKKETKQKKS